MARSAALHTWSCWLGNSTSAGAEREAWEEAQAKIHIEGLLAIYDIPRISQVQLIYRARLIDEINLRGLKFR